MVIVHSYRDLDIWKDTQRLVRNISDLIEQFSNENKDQYGIPLLQHAQNISDIIKSGYESGEFKTYRASIIAAQKEIKIFSKQAEILLNNKIITPFEFQTIDHRSDGVKGKFHMVLNDVLAEAV